ncbi:MAG: chemotaxis protein [Rhizobiales bacterium]|nr:chemotaxis protein [Hyphomicrobiales bacterium]MBO6697750.1 chemotaxis protein [Hyphomicrobiales bacterium]MBO6735995.1 chemotaxis protein [Hyphomicrobiales bacterium]MBO6912465.1 chemotaxis protein [Hyphomicrobiales bacterium]MBO6955096.1 chemotaxis protein [Hyphomicrobiales bacterium]
MLNLPLSLVIEGLVAILLVITIGYCILLNSRLKRLRADEEGLRATIAELLTATEIAERAIQGLRTTSAQCDQTLGQRLHQANQVSEELSTKLNSAGAVVERLGKMAGLPVGEAKAPAASPRPIQPAANRAPAAQAGPATQSAPAAPSPSQRLDDAARALQDRLQRVAS